MENNIPQLTERLNDAYVKLTLLEAKRRGISLEELVKDDIRAGELSRVKHLVELEAFKFSEGLVQWTYRICLEDDLEKYIKEYIESYKDRKEENMSKTYV